MSGFMFPFHLTVLRLVLTVDGMVAPLEVECGRVYDIK